MLTLSADQTRLLSANDGNSSTAAEQFQREAIYLEARIARHLVLILHAFVWFRLVFVIVQNVDVREQITDVSPFHVDVREQATRFITSHYSVPS